MKALKIARELYHDDRNKIRTIELLSGQVACAEDKFCTELLVVEKGCLRVFKRAFDGRTFTLYRVNPGECCSLTISCILNQTTFPAIVEVEDDISGYVVSAQHVRQWLKNDNEWQAYFFQQLTQKLTQLTDLTDNLVFSSMDSRIANMLCRLLAEKGVIFATHQCIANEVGTSREVVSRSLRLLESKGYIKLLRGKIEVTRLDALKDFSILH